MTGRLCSVTSLCLLLAVALMRPAAAQVLESTPGPVSFPVLGGASYRIDPQSTTAHSLFKLSQRELLLRSNAAGWIDMDGSLEIPDRHWGPVSIVSCTLEVSGRKMQTGMAIPSRIPLAGVPLGGTVTLRLLVQAPLIVFDIEGNPSAVTDTFVEEYTWTLVNRSP